MSLELALKALVAEVVLEVLKTRTGGTGAAPVDPTPAPAPVKRGPGRPAKGETPAAPAAATQAAAAAPTAVAATPATAPTAVKLTHKDLAPTFLAIAKVHGRAFVVDVMRQAGATGTPEPTFDKVPADRLPYVKELLEAGPQVKTVVGDEDLLG